VQRKTRGEGKNRALLEVVCICTCGIYLRVPEGSIWRLPSSQVGGVWVLIVLHVPGTQGISSGYFFAPVGHRLNDLVRRRAPATLSIASPLSYCTGPIMDHVAVWCGLTSSTIGDCFSSPVHQYFTRSFRLSFVLLSFLSLPICFLIPAPRGLSKKVKRSFAVCIVFGYRKAALEERGGRYIGPG